MKDRPKIQSPKEAFNVLNHVWDKNQIGLIEECKLLLLDNRLRLMSIANLSFGGMTQTLVDPRVVFSLALKRRAHKLIIAHNHPTGNLEPSIPDFTITKNLIALGEMLNIELEDHLIITSDGYHSIMHDGNEGLRYE